MLREHSTPAVSAYSYDPDRQVLGTAGLVRNVALSGTRLMWARCEVLCLLPGGGDLEWLRAAADKTRVVVSETMPRLGYEIRDFMDRGGAVRVRNQVSPRLVVVDREIAFLRTGADTDTVIRSPDVVDRLVTVFEAHWAGAQAPDADRPLNDQEYAVISLLASGMTDEAVARKLDVSPRTVQRHVRRIMELFDVHSRFELGIHITRRGVL